MTVPIPVQTCSISPYSSYNSNVVNALTRLISNGTNCVIASAPITVALDSTSSITVNQVHCIKDDVLIQISDITIDLTDADSYANPSGGHFNEDGYYYVVLEYTYIKSKPAPVAAIKIILPSQRTDPAVFNTAHLFLAALNIQTNSIENILSGDPEIPANKVPYSETGFSEKASPSGDHSIQPQQKTVLAEGGATMTMPSTIFNTEHTIINKDGNGPVTILAISGETIEGNTQITLNLQYDSVTLLSNETDTWIEV